LTGVEVRTTISGTNAVASDLRGLASRLPRKVTNATYDWAMESVVRQLVAKPPPPKRPGQRYRRTGRLQARWHARANGRGVEIYNEQPYAGYVVGDAKRQRQAWMHKGRWYLFADVVKGARPALRQRMATLIRQEAGAFR